MSTQTPYADGLIRGTEESGVVLVDGKPLPLKPSLAIENHSPTGFAWGYLGSGPAQLALALLLELTDRPFAQTHYQQFKDAFVSRWHGDFEAPLAPIEAWIDAARIEALERERESGPGF